MTAWSASAPGKLIIAGEYAVLAHAPALVIAVDRRVTATRRLGPSGSSPFLVAVAAELARRRGDADPAARAALEIAVDSRACYEGGTKLGLGSSAAVTVAATALALASTGANFDRDEVLAIALAAHASAQSARGSAGSGADIAAAVYGGVIEFKRRRLATPGGGLGPDAGADVLHRRWPNDVTLLPFFTGRAADTATLVAQVAAARAAKPVDVDAAIRAIGDASVAACAVVAAQESSGTALIAALSLAGRALDRLATVTGVALVPECVTAARAVLARFGGTAKTTGAGGGDVAIGVIPAKADATAALRLIIECGCKPLSLAVDPVGVDLRPVAQ